MTLAELATAVAEHGHKDLELVFVAQGNGSLMLRLRRKDKPVMYDHSTHISFDSVDGFADRKAHDLVELALSTAPTIKE